MTKLWKYVATKVEKTHSSRLRGRVGSNLGKINSWIANFVDPTIGFQLPKLSHPKDAWLAPPYMKTNSAKK